MARKPRERIYIIPRWTGLAFAAALMLIFAIGFAFPSSRGLTQTLGIALVVAGLVALIQTNENIRGVIITGCRIAPVAAGDDAILEITLTNTAPSERIGLKIHPGAKWSQAWRKRPRHAAWVPMLRAGESETVRMRLPTTRRGRHATPDLWVSSVMPVGLCFAWKSFAQAGEYIVYPRPRGLPLEGDGRRGIGTSHGLETGSEDVSGHRPYETGDPLSRMDWRVFARTGKMVVRTLEDGAGGEVLLRWEDTRFLDDDEARLEQLSYWMSQCVREGRPFRLEMGAHRQDLNSRNVVACQEALATFPGGSAA